MLTDFVILALPEPLNKRIQTTTVNMILLTVTFALEGRYVMSL